LIGSALGGGTVMDVSRGPDEDAVQDARAGQGRGAVDGDRSRDKWWQSVLRTEIDRIESTLLASRGSTERSSLARRIEAELHAVRVMLAEYSRLPWWWRFGRGSVTYERAMARVLAASEDLLLVASAEAALAQVPGIRAGVRTYLGSGDPRHDEFVRFCDGLIDRNLKAVPPPPPTDVTATGGAADLASNPRPGGSGSTAADHG
jgi:hypothetical protein